MRWTVGVTEKEGTHGSFALKGEGTARCFFPQTMDPCGPAGFKAQRRGPRTDGNGWLSIAQDEARSQLGMGHPDVCPGRSECVFIQGAGQAKADTQMIGGAGRFDLVQIPQGLLTVRQA